MNFAIHGIEGNIGPKNANTFHGDLYKDLKADYIIANPPFNISDCGGGRLRDGMRWKYGTPPAGNANFTWVQQYRTSSCVPWLGVVCVGEWVYELNSWRRR